MAHEGPEGQARGSLPAAALVWPVHPQEARKGGGVRGLASRGEEGPWKRLNNGVRRAPAALLPREGPIGRLEGAGHSLETEAPQRGAGRPTRRAPGHQRVPNAYLPAASDVEGA